jgi:hypothetical protein
MEWVKALASGAMDHATTIFLATAVIALDLLIDKSSDGLLS